MKEQLKVETEGYSRQERYIKHLHSKITGIEVNLRKLLVPKVEIKKTFSKEELQQAAEEYNKLKDVIEEKKRKLTDMKKGHDERIDTYVKLSEKIEEELKENEKINRKLILKKNELKNIVKKHLNADKITNHNTKNLIKSNGDISHVVHNFSDMRFINEDGLNYQLRKDDNTIQLETKE